MIREGKFDGIADAEAAVAGLIDYANQTNYRFRGINGNDITLGQLVKVPTPEQWRGYDYVRVTVNPKPGGRYVNGADFTYRRIPLDGLAGSPDGAWGGALQYFHLPLSGLPVEPTTLHGMLPHFNAYFGLELRPQDVIDKPLTIDNGVRFCKLELTDQSRLIGEKLGNRDVWVYFGEKSSSAQSSLYTHLQMHNLPDSYLSLNTLTYTAQDGFNITTTNEERLLTAIENELGKPGGTFNGPAAALDIVLYGDVDGASCQVALIPRPNSIYLPDDVDFSVIGYNRFDLHNFHRRFLPHAEENIQLPGGETVGLFKFDVSEIDPDKAMVSFREVLEWFNTKYKANLRINLVDWPNLEDWYPVTGGIRAFTPSVKSPLYSGQLLIRLHNSNQ